MRSTPKLVLRRDVLVELDVDDLRAVAGAATRPGASCQCPSYSQYCITGDAMCDTLVCP